MAGTSGSVSGGTVTGVTPEILSSTATACDNTADEIQAQLAQLQSYIEQMEGWWQGIASGAFRDLMTQYSRDAALLYQALTDIGSGLRGNYVNITDSEQANVTSVTSIQTSLSSTNFS